LQDNFVQERERHQREQADLDAVIQGKHGKLQELLTQTMSEASGRWESIDDRLETIDRQSSIHDGLLKTERGEREDEHRRLWDAMDNHTHNLVGKAEPEIIRVAPTTPRIAASTLSSVWVATTPLSPRMSMIPLQRKGLGSVVVHQTVAPMLRSPRATSPPAITTVGTVSRRVSASGVPSMTNMPTSNVGGSFTSASPIGGSVVFSASVPSGPA